VWAVGAGLDDSGLIGRRTVRRSLGLAVAGSVLLTAGLSIWGISAVGQVVSGTAAGATRLAGLGLMAAGALCGLTMMVILVAAGRMPGAADEPPAESEPADVAGLAAATAPRIGGMAPDPGTLPERVPVAGLPPSRPAADQASQWPPPPADGPRHAADQQNFTSPVPDEEAPLAADAAQPGPVWSQPPARPTVGWNPDSPEDWLRVLRGLRGSEESPADRHISHED
jgi:hypothetical protein